MPIANVEFKNDGGRWSVQVSLSRPGTSETPGLRRIWEAPDGDRRPSFDQHAAELKGPANADEPWRLRISAIDAAGARVALPPGVRWARLQVGGDSLFDQGWTLAELRGGLARREVVFGGDVYLLGAASWTPTLARALGGRCRPLARFEDPSRDSIWIVTDAPTKEQADEIWREAEERGVAVLVWAASDPPPQGDVIHVVTQMGSPDRRAVSWLVGFVKALANRGPELAFRDAEIAAPDEERGKRWLRGACDTWIRPTQAKGAPQNWRDCLDRLVHEAKLRTLAEALYAQGTARRVQVVVTPGDVQAGLDYFCQRRVDVRPTPSWRPCGWSESDGNQLRALARAFGLPSNEPDLRKLAGQVARWLARRNDLFWVVHEIRELVVGPAAGGGEPPALPLAQLDSYVASLAEIAGQMKTGARMLVHVLVVPAPGVTAADLRSRLRKRATAALHVEVLDVVERQVPWEEIRFYLEVHGVIEPSDEDSFARAQAATREATSYPELLDRLNETLQLD